MKWLASPKEYASRFLRRIIARHLCRLKHSGMTASFVSLIPVAFAPFAMNAARNLVSNPSVVRKMIGLGLGVGFWPEHSWGTLNKKDAKLVAVDEPTFTREIILAKTSRTSNKAILDEFEACLVKKFTRAWGD